MSEDIKPCPFCGGTMIDIRSNGIGDYFCICDGDESEMSCGARTSDSNCESQENAVRRWNRRARRIPLGGEGKRSEMNAPIPERHKLLYQEAVKFERLHNSKNSYGLLIEEIAEREYLIREALPYLAAYNTPKGKSEIYRMAEELLR